MAGRLTPRARPHMPREAAGRRLRDPSYGCGERLSVYPFCAPGATRIVWSPTRVWGWEVEDERLPLHRMRASDAERDLTVDRLTTAFVEGRLDHEEYDHRVGLALGAVLLGDLRALTRDLPSPEVLLPTFGPAWGERPVGRDPWPRHDRGTDEPGDVSVVPTPWREWGDEWRWWSAIAAALTSVWGLVSLLGGELVPYWPLVPLGIWAAVLLASAIWPSEEEPP